VEEAFLQALHAEPNDEVVAELVNSPKADPPGPSQGSRRVIRGGGWFEVGQDCRSACRAGAEPGHRGSALGFRVALVPSPE